MLYRIPLLIIVDTPDREAARNLIAQEAERLRRVDRIEAVVIKGEPRVAK